MFCSPNFVVVVDLYQFPGMESVFPSLRRNINQLMLPTPDDTRQRGTEHRREPKEPKLAYIRSATEQSPPVTSAPPGLWFGAALGRSWSRGTMPTAFIELKSRARVRAAA
jgi:hypothetical protein